MDYRTLIKSGQSSLIVSLPQAWVKQHNLGKGDSVGVDIVGEKVIVSPVSERKDAKPVFVIKNSAAEREYIEEILYAAVLSDKNEIRIDNVDSEQFYTILKFIKRLHFIRISERTSTSVLLSFIADIQSSDLRQEIRKMLLFLDVFFDVLMHSNDRAMLVDAYDQIVSHHILLLKAVKIKFYAYDENTLIRYKQIIDSFYFFLKVCDQFTAIPNVQNTHSKDVRKEIEWTVEALRAVIQPLFDEDLIAMLREGRRIDKRTDELSQKIVRGVGDENSVQIFLLIRTIHEILKNILYAQINNR